MLTLSRQHRPQIIDTQSPSHCGFRRAEGRDYINLKAQISLAKSIFFAIINENAEIWENFWGPSVVGVNAKSLAEVRGV